MPTVEQTLPKLKGLRAGKAGQQPSCSSTNHLHINLTISTSTLLKLEDRNRMNLAMQLKMKLAIVIVGMLCYGALGQQSCVPFVTSLSSCMSYILGNASAPSPLCCSSFADVVQTQARCLCTAINIGAAQLGIPVNQTQALTLPGVCSVTVPPLNQCNAAAAGTTQGAQVPTSSAIPLGPSAPGPSTPSTPTPALPKGKTSTVVSSSALISAKQCTSMLSLLVILASYASSTH